MTASPTPGPEPRPPVGQGEAVDDRDDLAAGGPGLLAAAGDDAGDELEAHAAEVEAAPARRDRRARWGARPGVQPIPHGVARPRHGGEVCPEAGQWRA